MHTIDIDEFRDDVSDDAFLVTIEGEKHWFPKTITSVEGSELTAPVWLLERKGVI